MKVTVLIDNNPHPKLSLCHEHGLSFYFEFDGFKWLLDVGASDKFYHNAQKLGINISDVDYLIISHGHADHAGGLQKFLEVNTKAKVFLSSHIKDKTFYSQRRGPERNISIDQGLMETYAQRFEFIHSNTSISENISLLCEFSDQYPKPKANQTLYILESEQKKADTFNHEIVLNINTPKGIIVFSGCSHNGILNILKSCSTFYSKNIVACIGGTHLISSDEKLGFESEKEIQKIASMIKRCYPNIILITGHCTGREIAELLSQELDSNFKTFYTGYEIVV